jgi:hypothetical protein
MSGVVQGTFSWTDHSGDHELGYETGLELGLIPRLSAGVLADFGDEGEGWQYRSVMPYLHFDLTPHEKSPIRFAAMVGYEFGVAGDDSHAEMRDSTPASPRVRRTAKATSTATVSSGATSTAAEPCGPAYGPDAPPCAEAGAVDSRHDHASHSHAESADAKTSTSTHSHGGRTAKEAHGATGSGHSHSSGGHGGEESGHEHGGIHRHGATALHARFIMEADVTDADKVVLNLVALVPKEGKPAWGYAAGWRHTVTHHWALGLEATGDFGDANEHEMVLGSYVSVLENITLKGGIGFGLTEESPDLTARLGLIYRF